MLGSQSCTSSQEFSTSTFNNLPSLFNAKKGSDYCGEGVKDGVAEGAGLAHDAGNILGALSIYAELLAGPGVLSNEYRPYAEEIRLLAERSNLLIERLTGYRRQSLRTEDRAVLPEVVNNYKGLLSRIIRRPIEVTVSPYSFFPVGVSSEIIERILLNLVKNAAAVTPTNGTISVSVEGGDDTDESGRRHVGMTVRDDGPGMSRSTIDKLHGATLGQKTQRRGLGLRIVRELVTQSDGYVDVDSYAGCGSRVSVIWFEKIASFA